MRALALVLLALGACQPLNTAAAAGGGNQPDPTDLNTPPIDLGDSGTTTDPCVATTTQSIAILTASCAPCHNQGNASAGNPPFGFILDVTMLKSSMDPRDGVSRLLKPGDPLHSVIYVRTARNEMPPNQDLIPIPRPTISDLSVLQTWINNCLWPDPLGGTPPDASVPVDAGTPADAGEDLRG